MKIDGIGIAFTESYGGQTVKLDVNGAALRSAEVLDKGMATKAFVIAPDENYGQIQAGYSMSLTFWPLTARFVFKNQKRVKTN